MLIMQVLISIIDNTGDNNLKKKFYRLCIELTNHKLISNLLMKFSQSKISKPLIGSYGKIYKVNWSEVKRNKEDFQSLHELFIRELKEDARKIDNDLLSVVSPVDAVYEDSGLIENNAEITVKGKVYSIDEMLGNQQRLQKYLGGQYMVLYLSPSHYHRIHAPVSGEIVNTWSLGKNSYPVNQMGMKYGKAPLSKNFRVISEIKHEKGYLSVVKVGAMFVNSIQLINEYSTVQKGQEMAYFSFGSTIVLLFEKGTFSLNDQLQTHQQVKVGEVLGFLK